MTAVTTCWACKLFGDTDPLAAQSGHLPDAQTGSGPFPGMVGHPENNTRSHGERSGRPQDPRPGIPQNPRGTLEGSALDPAPFPFRQPAPDPEPLVVLERVLQALGTHLTAAAHLLGFPGRAALLRKERLGIGLCAQRTVLPVQALGIVLTDTEDAERDDFRHGAPPYLARPRRHAPYPRGRRANYTSEITPACLASRQAGCVIMTGGFAPNNR